MIKVELTTWQNAEERGRMRKNRRIMRHPSTRYRIAGQAIPEIVEALEAATTKLGRRLTFRGGKLKEGPLVMSLVCYCLPRSDCEMEAMARICLTKYEEMLNSLETLLKLKMVMKLSKVRNF